MKNVEALLNTVADDPATTPVEVVGITVIPFLAVVAVVEVVVVEVEVVVFASLNFVIPMANITAPAISTKMEKVPMIPRITFERLLTIVNVNSSFIICQQNVLEFIVKS